MRSELSAIAGSFKTAPLDASCELWRTPPAMRRHALSLLEALALASGCTEPSGEARAGGRRTEAGSACHRADDVAFVTVARPQAQLSRVEARAEGDVGE